MKKKSTEEMINNGQTIVSFASTKLFMLNDAGLLVVNDNFDRREKIRHIHLAIGKIMEPITEMAITDCPDKNETEQM